MSSQVLKPVFNGAPGWLTGGALDLKQASLD
jgi:hypothetical protein